MRERETVRGGEKDSFWILLIIAFYHLTIRKKFAGFPPLWFPRWKYLCLVYLFYLMLIIVLVILPDKYPNKLLKPQLCMWLIRVSKACNTWRKPSQRLQTIPCKYCSILKLFGIVISHWYFCSLRWLMIGFDPQRIYFPI